MLVARPQSLLQPAEFMSEYCSLTHSDSSCKSTAALVARMTFRALLLAVENGEASSRRFSFSHLWLVYLDALSGAPESQTPRDHPFGEAVSLHTLRFLWLSHAWHLWTCAPPSERVVSTRTWAG